VFFQVTIPIVPLLLMAIKYQTWNSEIQEGGRGLMTLSMNAGFMLTGLAFIASVAGGVLVLAAPRTPQAISPPIVATTVDPVPAPTSPHDLPNDSQAYCPRCGTHNTEPGQFCTECGCAFK
jgi:hypothetical protein